jgi:hypothetical protein
VERREVIPLPWSHSALGDFKNCPKAYYEKRVAKSVVDAGNDAGAAGDYTHKAFEAYLKDRTPLPTTYPDNIRDWPLGLKPPVAYRGYLDSLLAEPGEMFPECKYALTKKLEPCDWMAPDAWCRCIIDVLLLDGENARIVDHKTGKRKNDLAQLRLCALMVFRHHPEVQRVKVAYAWLKETMEHDAYVTFSREDEASMWQTLVPDLRLYREAFKLEVFNPKQSGLCNGWCPVTDCEYWKPKRRM